ncbi:MAG: tyrosine-type recombinase/integrase [Desulfobacteraceae bacterium]|nr:tyrosine-type recombinase/integrase [Desulfobacteraceae bacterium]
MAVKTATFFKHIEPFLNNREKLYEDSDQTIKSHRTDLSLFDRFIRSKGYKTITGKATMAFQFYLKEDRLNCGGSINRKIYTLRSYSKYLKTMGVRHADQLPFFDVLKIRQGYRNRPSALTLSQVKSLFEQIDRSTVLGVRDYAVYALMYQTGLRVGEVHALDLESIDFDNQQITVMGKGKKIRQLHLTRKLCHILYEYLAVREFFYNYESTSALFVSKKGNRLAIRTMEDNMKKLLKKVEFIVPFNVTCHTLRHSFASHLNDKDVDILVIQSLMGHASTRSTEPYIHPSMEKIRAAMEKLPGVLYMKKLLKDGVLNLPFQNNQPRRL